MINKNASIVSQASASAPPPSEQESLDVDDNTTLPPVIKTNPRSKIEPQLVTIEDLVTKEKEKVVERHPALMFLHKHVMRDPVPKYHMAISWYPKVLCFKLYNEPLTKTLTISNRSDHILYICRGGLWDDTARLGASWYLKPKTRFLLAPGMVDNLFLQAAPREISPVPAVDFSLQLAANFPRDIIVGYFVVPINVKFGNYIEPEMTAAEG